MLSHKETLLLSCFRKDARQSLTKISRVTGIPVSTIFDRLKQYEECNIIKKHAALLNFRELGYDLRVNFLLASENKVNLLKFLMGNFNINSIFKVNNEYDYLVEGIFKNMLEYQDFIDNLSALDLSKREEHFVLEEIKREAFLENYDVLHVK